MSQLALAVIATGMICSLGNRTATECAATKAGISGCRAGDILNRRNKAIVMAQVPDGAMPPLKTDFTLLNQQLPGHTYMVQLAASALLDCLSDSARRYPLPIFMACPELLPGFNARLEPSFIEHLKSLSGCNIDIAYSRGFAMGRSGGFEALKIAYAYFEATGNEFALVGGVDSFRHFSRQIEALDKDNRLVAEGATNAFAIGEGACFHLLATPRAVLKYSLSPKLYLGYPAVDQEPGHRFSQLPYQGNGLSAAFNRALAASPNIPIESIYSSLNGEAFGTKELGVARIRNQRRLSLNAPVHHPADCFGDLGAAMAPMLWGIVAQNEKLPSLVYCSSDGPDRGAVCVWQPEYN